MRMSHLVTPGLTRPWIARSALVPLALVSLALVPSAACSSDDGSAGAGAGSGNDTAGTIGDAAQGSDAADSSGATDTGTTTGTDTGTSTDTGAVADSSAPGDTTGASDTAAPQDTGPIADADLPATCAKLAEAACKSAQSCVAIYGADPCTDGGFGAAKTYAGCMSAAGGCGQAFTCGEKDGQRLSFSTTCQPEGWTHVGSDISQCCKSGADPADWGKCSKDADCAVFQTECCDHCNGGKLMAVNQTYVDAAKAKHAKTAEQCGQTACTLKACGKPLAVCDKGACVPKVGDL